MAKLIVRQFGGNHVGAVTPTTGGALAVQGATPQFERELRALLNDIAAPTLAYRTGQEERTAEGVAHQTVVKQCHKDDPDYLRALCDLLPQHQIGGKRVRGVVVE